MKIRGVLVDILCNIDPSYKEFVVIEHGEKVLYNHILRDNLWPASFCISILQEVLSKYQERGI